MKARTWVALCAAILALLGGIGYALFALGSTAQEAKTTKADAAATIKAQAQANNNTRAGIARATSAGRAREQGRQAIDTFFQQIDREVHDAPSSADDDYVLPDDRLRLWRKANAGRPDSGASARQSHDGAAGAAAALVGADTGARNESPRGGSGLSPAGNTGVQPAGLSADDTGGL